MHDQFESQLGRIESSYSKLDIQIQQTNRTSTRRIRCRLRIREGKVHIATDNVALTFELHHLLVREDVEGVSSEVLRG